MRYLGIIFALLSFVGCSATIKGVKEDVKSAAEWSKRKINEAATIIKEKTE